MKKESATSAEGRSIEEIENKIVRMVKEGAPETELFDPQTDYRVAWEQVHGKGSASYYNCEKSLAELFDRAGNRSKAIQMLEDVLFDADLDDGDDSAAEKAIKELEEYLGKLESNAV